MSSKTLCSHLLTQIIFANCHIDFFASTCPETQALYQDSKLISAILVLTEDQIELDSLTAILDRASNHPCIN